MKMEWTSIDEALPPPGVPLIVTVACADDGKRGPKLEFPVVYRKSLIRDKWGFWVLRLKAGSSTSLIRDKWGFYEHSLEDEIIGPEYSRVTAWMVLPAPYTGDVPAESEEPKLDEALRWISVEERLPEPGQETWVYALPHEDMYTKPEIDFDTYDGCRGEIFKVCSVTGERYEESSGWDVYSGWNVTHWMPLIKPEAPK